MTIIENALSNPVFALIGDTADQLGLKAYVIGGYVRDCFLGRPNKDIDVVVEGSGIALAEAIAAKTGAKVSVYSNFGTAMLHNKGIELEFVGARKESYHRESRKPIVEDGTLEEDQLRRDFTINAMAFSLNKADFGALVDPFGGIKDLSEGIIRTPLEPQQTYSDDPLRMLRAIRFCVQLSTPEHPFHIVQESLQAMYEMRERLKILSSERIVEEVNKMLLADKPSAAFRLMDETGLLEQFLPELTNLKGVETVDGKGHKDNFSHSLQVLDNVADADGEEPNLWLRWAALLHDIGKAPTKRFIPGQGWTFHGHEVVGARMVPRIFQRLHMPLNEKMKYVQKLVSLHLRPIALVDDEVTDSAVRRLLFDAGDDIDDLMLLSNADITSKNPAKVARLRRNFELVKEKMAEVEEKDAIRNFKNPITGDMVMEIYGIGPCNLIGEIKEYVKEAILDGVIPNEQEAAERLMREKAAELGLRPVK
ncbi:MAG: HD domain-containing protein [Bacteroidales bacterium]|nr:HD domain-containing protein [Bacteroidales bacterium]